MAYYVDFECTHIAQAEQGGPDGKEALAYADIDGYPADEDSEGTVICRVWLLKYKSGASPAYLVDWYHNEYRMDAEVCLIIEDAKKDLAEYKGTLVKDVFASAYEKYRLGCMLDNGFTLTILLQKLDAIVKEGRAGNAVEALGILEADMHEKKHQEVWRSEDMFRVGLWDYAPYMSKILAPDEYVVWENR